MKSQNKNKKNSKNNNKNFVSPYQQAGSILNQIWSNSSISNSNSKSSLKAVVYDASSGNLKCSSSTYAICSKVLQQQAMLQSVLEHATNSTSDGLLSNNDIQNEGLFYVLLYELLLGPNKAIRGGGALKRQIVKHEAVLRKALTEVQQQSKGGEHQNKEEQLNPFPRFVRVNTLRSTTSHVVATWRQQQQQKKDNDKSSSAFYQDVHVPDLLVFPHVATKYLLSSSLSRNHEIILQDKSSCFPALCLVHGFSSSCSGSNDTRHRRVYLDACAAPGNKTSHLAALALQAAQQQDDNDNDDDNSPFPIQVYALDRSKDRCAALKRRMKQLLPDSIDKVQIHAQCRDFLSLGRPEDKDTNSSSNNNKIKSKKHKKSDNSKHNNGESNNDDDHDLVQQVTDILLDPSCSGSGIFHRSSDNDTEENNDDSHRLQSLSNFQTTALRHALTNFEHAQRVVYSTCSIHYQENEGVVAEVLSDESISSKWQLVAPACLSDWKRRGRGSTNKGDEEKSSSGGYSHLTKEQLAAMIRVDYEDETNGFFVACFARKDDNKTATRPTKKKKKKKSSTSIVVPVRVPNVPLYNGEFKTPTATPKKKDKAVGKNKDKEILATKTEETKMSSSITKGKKRRSESKDDVITVQQQDPKDEDSGGHEHSNKKKKTTKSNKSEDETTAKPDHQEHEKPLPKKIAKKFEWKRRQREKKLQRLQSKQQKSKEPKA